MLNYRDRADDESEKQDESEEEGGFFDLRSNIRSVKRMLVEFPGALIGELLAGVLALAVVAAVLWYIHGC